MSELSLEEVGESIGEVGGEACGCLGGGVELGLRSEVLRFGGSERQLRTSPSPVVSVPLKQQIASPTKLTSSLPPHTLMNQRARSKETSLLASISRRSTPLNPCGIERDSF